MRARSFVRRVGHCSGRDPADGVPCSANVPRPSGSSFISLRKAPHRRDRWKERLLIGGTPQRAPCTEHRVLPAAKSRRRPQAGGHSRRGVPGDLRTRPEQQHQEQMT
ncbi:hypothetical protein VAPA_1c34940 [Variovorax paradoxus B4]|uniref:Uncharacterized protein n=1 Tax=Variovorax paradoxus B4 TaxID=1246301 RepID=T1XDG8_VARPD|nr:hypothetical protein VAPA_1c34940 [Variovorax paradoxus B4]